MENTNPSNPNAFPSMELDKARTLDHFGVYFLKNEGMTLRDYFAAKAITAIVDSTYFNQLENDWDNQLADKSAEIAYKIADAMLKQREVQ